MRLLKIKTLFAAFILSVITSTGVIAQGGCMEIKSILVDACGSPEGENEMVLFETGSSALNISNLIVDWPNNNWLGLCQNATTATLVTTINQAITGCGSVAEPVGGVLTANTKVLLVTSTNINAIINSFANLNDDIIILFQCSGNTSGHFANYNTVPGLRTLIIEFTGSCTDSVTYDRTLLVNQFGVIGGLSFENDGAFVDYDVAGNATYKNFGCQALSTGFSLNGGPDVGICPGGNGTASLNGTALNLIGNPQWSGGTGTFNPANALSTVYTPGAGETGIVYLTVTGNGPCNTTITDTVRVNIVPSLPTVTVTVSVDGIFYSSFSDPGYFYNWYADGSPNYIPGAFGSTYIPNSNGCYYMVLSTIGGCSVQSNTECITNVGIAESSSEASLILLNNPGYTPSFILNTNNVSGEVNMEIFDVFGRLISKVLFEIRNNVTEISPDWSDLAGGVYVIRISQGTWFAESKAVLLK